MSGTNGSGALTADRAREIVSRATGFKGTPTLDHAFREFLTLCGISEDEWGLLLVNRPELATTILRDIEGRFRAGLVLVHDAVLKAALQGKVTAMKLFYERFDDDYVPKKQNINDQQAGDMSRDAFVRMMELRYGDDWRTAKRLSEERGQLGGVMGEELLEGGRDEDREVVDMPEEPTDSGQDEPGNPEDWF